MKRLALTEPELRKSALRPGDLLFARRSLVAEGAGKCSVVKQVSEPTTFESSIIRARPDPQQADSDYLYYYFASPQGRELMRTILRQVAVSGIAGSDLAELRVPVPPIEVQRKCARFLELMDDRIDLLRQTNATLESIAQALFKSWFIDFDPVRAKAEGREPEGMDAATAALFPSEFEESALGLIPKGWAVEPIGDLVDAVGGSTPDTKNPSFWEPAVHHWTSPKDLSGATSPVLLDTERKVSPAGLAKISSGTLPAGSLLMSSRAPIGYLTLTQVPVAINQGYIAMPPGGRLPPVYLYFWCQANMDGIKGRANGSTFMEISKKAFRPIPALLPPQYVTDSFVELANSLFNRLVANERQARALVELRDALLPRLISGKLRLPEAQAQLEEAIA
ncbi:MAG: restriction endonuclease subunit S [Pseudomonadota bacterium]|nr:restriction endonuclease subunit S [Pseudomonadota bacterium]